MFQARILDREKMGQIVGRDYRIAPDDQIVIPARLFAQNRFPLLRPARQHAAAAVTAIAAHGGSIVLRGGLVSIEAGEDHHLVGLIGFPSADAARKWYESDDYQALIETRDAAGAFRISLYQTVE